MAVYTKVSQEDLSGFLELYNIGNAVQLTGIESGVENSNYLLQTDQGQFILTLFEKRVREEDLPFFMNLMRHLVAKGLPTAGPVEDLAGGFLNRLNGRPAAIINFLDGKDKADLSVSDCAACGSMTARLQLATSDFHETRKNDLSLAGWVELFEKCKTDADRCEPDLAAEIEEELNFLDANWPSENALPRGVVHVDLFPDNIFFKGNDLSGVIDFYFACTDFYAYDLAICLTAWVFDAQHEFCPAKAKAMLDAYQNVRALSENEKSSFQLLCRGAAIRFLLTRLYDWLNQDPGALVKVKDPLEYQKKSRFYRQANLTELFS